MKATETQIEERLPVWQSLSEFFLDTKLQSDDYERIANKLAVTAYSIDEIEDILVCEVCPACKLNLLSVAGEWAGFDTEWLKRRIAPRFGKSFVFKKLFIFRHRWMYAGHWARVAARIAEIRKQNDDPNLHPPAESNILT